MALRAGKYYWEPESIFKRVDITAGCEYLRFKRCKMIINSTGDANQVNMYAVSSRSRDVEAAETRPDNEGTEALKSKAPLADGQGVKIDLLA